MDTHSFTGKAPITIFDLFTRYVEDTDKVVMSEDQAYLILPQYLKIPEAALF